MSEMKFIKRYSRMQNFLNSKFIVLLKSKRLLISNFKAFILSFLSKNISYSQVGEDKVILEIIQNNGYQAADLFYVDLGANMPYQYSNTAMFYNMGSRGITIDASYVCCLFHKIFRPKDFNLNRFVDSTNFEYKEIYSNDFFGHDPKANFQNGKAINKKQKILKLKNISTNEIFELIKKKSSGKINLLSIDLEGIDDKIMLSFNRKILIFDIICFEGDLLNMSCGYLYQNKEDVFKMLGGLNYIKVSHNLMSHIWIKKDLSW